MNALCELSLCIVHSQGHIPLLFAKRSAETKFPFNILTLTTASCIHSHTITVLPLWRGVIVIITILTELVPLHSASYIPSDYVGSWNCVTVPPSFQVITHRANFGPASRVNTVRKKKKKKTSKQCSLPCFRRFRQWLLFSAIFEPHWLLPRLHKCSNSVFSSPFKPI